jgi:hypothetical protein
MEKRGIIMKEIKTICPNPACDRDISLDTSKIMRAMMRKKHTNGMPLIGCPACCHVMILPDTIPTNMTMFENFVTNLEKNNEWLGDCVPMIDPTMVRMPTGTRNVHGSTMYSSGTGEMLDKYSYMTKYGIDPECATYKTNKKPFIIQDR